MVIFGSGGGPVNSVVRRLDGVFFMKIERGFL
jgi:hypothetical protein